MALCDQSALFVLTKAPLDISYLINAISAEPRRRRLILPSGLQADSNLICEWGREGGGRGSDGGRQRAKDNKLRLDVDLKKKKNRKTSLGAP